MMLLLLEQFHPHGLHKIILRVFNATEGQSDKPCGGHDTRGSIDAPCRLCLCEFVCGVVMGESK